MIISIRLSHKLNDQTIFVQTNIQIFVLNMQKKMRLRLFTVKIDIFQYKNLRKRGIHKNQGAKDFISSEPN